MAFVEKKPTEVPVSDAKAQITDLVRRAEAGEEIVLTRCGKAVAKLVPVVPRPTAEARRAVLDAVRASGRAAAWSQDFLYDQDGMAR